MRMRMIRTVDIRVERHGENSKLKRKSLQIVDASILFSLFVPVPPVNPCQSAVDTTSNQLKFWRMQMKQSLPSHCRVPT
jgi:hypothetical protein